MYLMLNGSQTEYEGEALLDYVKLYLYSPSGAVFCNPSFGYKDMDESSVDSVQSTIEDALRESNHSITLQTVVKNSNKTITATFSGVDENLTLGTGD